jgi:hypothetical protein
MTPTISRKKLDLTWTRVGLNLDSMYGRPYGGTVKTWLVLSTLHPRVLVDPKKQFLACTLKNNKLKTVIFDRTLRSDQ